MVRHWRGERGPGRRGRAAINGTGAVLAFAALVVVPVGAAECERLQAAWRAWHRLPHDQRGVVLDRAIRRNTEAIVCRMRFHVQGW